MHKHVLEIMVLMIFSISLVACGNSEAKTNLTYEDIADMTIEKFESELPKLGELDYEPYDIDYGSDLRSGSDITMWENGKYVKFVVHDKEENKKETTYFRLKDDELVNVNGHPDIDFDSLEEQEPDYIEEKGEIIKE
ncbi:hypothetical protein WV34_03605 [Bacillus amyloliquefaciens]|uniref:hypothetical protein n=1 Tax=Bacillaceae TaxID=186817 RepID=UPI000B515E70|nr:MULTISPECIES: hypothetical protein [Bacillus amyloliquefaciens group]ASF27907.1 hypothetical protein WV34_03605 [Bacillus amyloliquefaciens]